MSTDLMILSRNLTRNDPADLDLTDPVHLVRTYEVADALLGSGAIIDVTSDIIPGESGDST